MKTMPDREKVFEIIKARINDDENDSEGSSGFICVEIDEAKEIVALLKEQEAVEPRVSTAEQRCGHCNKVIEMDGWKACPWCGKMIDWKRWWNKNGTNDNT